MKQFKLFRVIAFVWLSVFCVVLGDDTWMTDLEAAKKRAKDEGKPLMVEFTGSDWCPPCIMMEKEVFSKETFLKEAQKTYILVKLDTPKAEDKAEMKKANRELMKKYEVKGVPSVLLFDQEGKEFHRFVATQFRTVESFLENLDRQLLRKDMF